MRVGVTIFSAFMLIACDKSHKAGDSDTSPISASDYPERLSAAMNELDQRCCERTGLTLPEPNNDPWPEAQAKFDAKAAAQCLAQIARMPCPPAKGGSRESFQPSVCRKAFTGTVALGEPCFTPWDCAPSDEADGYTGCPLGLGFTSSICTHFILRKEGEGCARAPHDEVRCDSPLFCNEDKVCVAPAKLGERCLTGPQWGDTCESGAMCDRTDTKRCVKPTAVGKPCETIEDCESLACVQGTCREPLFILPLCEPE